MKKETIRQLEQYKPTVASSINWHIPRLLEEREKLLAALTEIHKLWCCPPPKTRKDWSARCDVMAEYARSAIAFAESE